MSEANLVSIIIPVWGDPTFTDICLETLSWTTEDYQLILVDNTNKYDVKTDKNLHAVFRNEENLGFAGGCNQGARAATGDVLVFLNCDTEPHFDWLAELMTAFDDDEVVMAGPKLVYPDGRIQCAGIRTWHGIGQAGGENRHDEHPTNSDEDGVTGACLAIRRDVFESLGGFDEAFWNGYDDVDLCLQVRDRGHKVAYVAESVVTHYESATGPERWTRSSENVAYMNEKWGRR